MEAAHERRDPVWCDRARIQCSITKMNDPTRRMNSTRAPPRGCRTWNIKIHQAIKKKSVENLWNWILWFEFLKPEQRRFWTACAEAKKVAASFVAEFFQHRPEPSDDAVAVRIAWFFDVIVWFWKVATKTFSYTKFIVCMLSPVFQINHGAVSRYDKLKLSWREMREETKWKDVVDAIEESLGLLGELPVKVVINIQKHVLKTWIRHKCRRWIIQLYKTNWMKMMGKGIPNYFNSKILPIIIIKAKIHLMPIRTSRQKGITNWKKQYWGVCNHWGWRVFSGVSM